MLGKRKRSPSAKPSKSGNYPPRAEPSLAQARLESNADQTGMSSGVLLSARALRAAKHGIPVADPENNFIRSGHQARKRRRAKSTTDATKIRTALNEDFEVPMAGEASEPGEPAALILNTRNADDRGLVLVDDNAAIIPMRHDIVDADAYSSGAATVFSGRPVQPIVPDTTSMTLIRELLGRLSRSRQVTPAVVASILTSVQITGLSIAGVRGWIWASVGFTVGDILEERLWKESQRQD